MKFKIGDRVECIGFDSHVRNGSTGVIETGGDELVWILWDQVPFKDMGRYSFNTQKIKKIEDNKVEPKASKIAPSNWGF